MISRFNISEHGFYVLLHYLLNNNHSSVHHIFICEILLLFSVMASMSAILLLVLGTLANGQNTPIDGTYTECSPEQDICEYWLTVKKAVTMIYKGDLVYPYKSKFYKYDEFPNNYTTEIPIDEVLSVDGVYRTVIAANGTIPGPPIVVYERQNVKIHVTNGLLTDSLSMHWHGLHQMGSPFMDGTAFITQCPILPGQTFTYKFEVGGAGTHWYHSHSGAQRSDGMFGAFIVKKRPTTGVEQPVDMIMTVGDWEHESADDLFTKSHTTRTVMDGKVICVAPWNSGLIEGKGRYIDKSTGKRTETPLTWFKVRKGQKYRFRVINFGARYSVRVSVDNHTINAVATDGFDVKPMEVESVVITPGERYDLFVTADQFVGNYWIRANYVPAIEQEIAPDENYVEAILHYDGASTTEEPTTSRDTCSSANHCKVLNCPFNTYPTAPYVDCILVTELESADDGFAAPEYDQESQEHFLNFHMPGPPMTVNPGAVNGYQYQYPRVSSLTQNGEIDDVSCDNVDCGEDKVCTCNHEILLPHDKTIQFVFINMGVGRTIGHPVHMHGHSFSVLKLEYLGNKTIDQVPNVHQDINCGATPKNFCNNAKWNNDTWGNGNVPGLKLTKPIRKDTLYVPTGAYAVVRIRSNNPGKWFIHCHMAEHALLGMAIVLSEGIDHLPNTPTDFPVCGSFTVEEDNVVPAAKDSDSTITFLILTATFIVICVLQFFVILYCAIKRRSGTGKEQPIGYVQENPHL